MVFLILKIGCVYLAGVGFGLIVNLPYRALNLAGISGVVGWGSYYLVDSLPNTGIGIANFSGAMALGIFAMIVARIMRMPSILFDVPGLVPLVPGGQAYELIKNFATGHYSEAWNYATQVIWIAGSIALGFIAAETILRIVHQVTTYRVAFRKKM
ncbi:threonine/serine exporter family protein [Lentilactobacillus senioris]|uniref:threonine/serine exporter family protein n=1 Tax=Lentilactobacillus senioris TaxID=931534 RepID=UPI003D2AF2B8